MNAATPPAGSVATFRYGMRYADCRTWLPAGTDVHVTNWRFMCPLCAPPPLTRELADPAEAGRAETKVRARAVDRLIRIHRPEFRRLLDQERDRS